MILLYNTFKVITMIVSKIVPFNLLELIFFYLMLADNVTILLSITEQSLIFSVNEYYVRCGHSSTLACLVIYLYSN